jgi:hypothetical protein
VSIADTKARDLLVMFLEETFEKHHGIYTDDDDNLFLTLSGITAQTASIPVGGRCAALSAQVKHVSYYLQVQLGDLTGAPLKDIDWADVWETTGPVNDDQWAAIVAELKAEYARVRTVVDETSDWAAGEVMAIIVHTAYHLGEIRQALCTLKA